MGDNIAAYKRVGSVCKIDGEEVRRAMSHMKNGKANGLSGVV